MANTITKQGVFCLGSKVSFLGTNIPVWCYNLEQIIIDTGPLSLYKEFLPAFKGLHIEQVLISHYHEDHCGLAPWLQQNSAARVHMPDLYIALAGGPAQIPLYRRLFWGKRQAFQAAPLPEVFSDNKYSFHAIPAPGHTKDHVAFLESSKGWLFSGDVFVRPRPELGFIEEDMSEMLQTLNNLIELDFDMLFCSHAGPQANGKNLLREKRDYLLEVQQKARELQEKGWPVDKIVSSIFPRKRLVEHITRGEWSRKNLVQSLL